jgi:hypothetical protein
MNISSVDKSIPVTRAFLPGAALFVALVVLFFFPAAAGAGNPQPTGRVEVIEAASDYAATRGAASGLHSLPQWTNREVRDHAR